VLTCVFRGGERAFVFNPAEEVLGGAAAAARMWERDIGAAGRAWERDRVPPGGGGGAAILLPIAATILMGILQNNER